MEHVPRAEQLRRRRGRHRHGHRLPPRGPPRPDVGEHPRDPGQRHRRRRQRLRRRRARRRLRERGRGPLRRPDARDALLGHHRRRRRQQAGRRGCCLAGGPPHGAEVPPGLGLWPCLGRTARPELRGRPRRADREQLVGRRRVELCAPRGHRARGGRRGPLCGGGGELGQQQRRGSALPLELRRGQRHRGGLRHAGGQPVQLLVLRQRERGRGGAREQHPLHGAGQQVRRPQRDQHGLPARQRPRGAPLDVPAQSDHGAGQGGRHGQCRQAGLARGQDGLRRPGQRQERPGGRLGFPGAGAPALCPLEDRVQGREPQGRPVRRRRHDHGLRRRAGRGLLQGLLRLGRRLPAGGARPGECHRREGGRHQAQRLLRHAAVRRLPRGGRRERDGGAADSLPPRPSPGAPRGLRRARARAELRALGGRRGPRARLRSRRTPHRPRGGRDVHLGLQRLLAQGRRRTRRPHRQRGRRSLPEAVLRRQELRGHKRRGGRGRQVHL
mmetsp:Transcript_29060/g.86280  ORF Transcript_29060/g.86280 Transcript_29060/m.86280 type:complete len:498 (-) Transcript_29060:531-2024(-)